MSTTRQHLAEVVDSLHHMDALRAIRQDERVGRVAERAMLYGELADLAEESLKYWASQKLLEAPKQACKVCAKLAPFMCAKCVGKYNTRR